MPDGGAGGVGTMRQGKADRHASSPRNNLKAYTRRLAAEGQEALAAKASMLRERNGGLAEESERLASMLKDLQEQMMLEQAPPAPPRAFYPKLSDREGNFWPREHDEKSHRRFPGALYARGTALEALKRILPEMFENSVHFAVYAAMTATGHVLSQGAMERILLQREREGISRQTLGRVLGRLRIRGVEARHVFLDMDAPADVKPSLLADKLDWGGRGGGGWAEEWHEAVEGLEEAAGLVAEALRTRPEGWDVQVKSPRNVSPGRSGIAFTATGASAGGKAAAAGSPEAPVVASEEGGGSASPEEA